MAKYLLRLKARELRNQGLSIRDIALQLKVSKSSVSYWVRDIILTVEQLEKLRRSELSGWEKGRLKSRQIKKEKRERLLLTFIRNGVEHFSYLNKKEFFIVGLALYWAEGGKSSRNRRVEFCNSDPRMIKFLILWLKECFEVESTNLRAVVGINEIHYQREQIVKEYWSKISGIPIEQFRKTSFKKVKNKKVYDNFDQHFGTLSILVAKSTNLYYKIMGLIEGLSSVNKIGQRSSGVRAVDS